MTEQSHKREMNEALLGDFERLQARRQRRHAGETPSASRPDPAVLTPSRRSVETVEGVPEQPRADERRRSWLRTVLRRNG